jgi:hypothetical protein
MVIVDKYNELEAKQLAQDQKISAEIIARKQAEEIAAEKTDIVMSKLLESETSLTLKPDDQEKLKQIVSDYMLSEGFAGARDTDRFYLPEDAMTRERKEAVNQQISAIQQSNDPKITEFYTGIKYYLNEILTSAMIADVMGINRVAVMGNNIIDLAAKTTALALSEIPGGDVLNTAISSIASYYPNLKFSDNYKKLVRLCGDGDRDKKLLVESLAIEITKIFIAQQSERLEEQEINKQGFKKILKKSKDKVKDTLKTLSPLNEEIDLKLSKIDPDAAFYGAKMIIAIFHQKLTKDSAQKRPTINRELINNLIASLQSELPKPPAKPNHQDLDSEALEAERKMRARREAKAREEEARRNPDVSNSDEELATPRTMMRMMRSLMKKVAAQESVIETQQSKIELLEAETRKLKAIETSTTNLRQEMEESLSSRRASLSARRESATPRNSAGNVHYHERLEDKQENKGTEMG